MPFHQHGDRLLAAPALERPSQRRQEQIADLRAVRRRRSLEELLRALAIELDLHRRGVFRPGTLFRVIAPQRGCLVPQPAAPVIHLSRERRVPGVAPELLRPALKRAALRRQGHGLSSDHLGQSALKILEQHAPGHAVDHEVMNDQEQTRCPIGDAHVHRPHQRPCLERQAPLRLLGDALHLGAVGRVAHPEYAIRRLLLRRRIPLHDAPRLRTIPQPQRIVMREQVPERAHELRRLERSPHLQQHRLVVVMRLRQPLIEELRLDRCQPDLARHRLRRSGLLLHHPRPARQRLERRVLEDLFGADPDSRLARSTHYLDRTDRVASALEEVVGQPHSRHPEHRLPDRGERFLDLCLRRDILVLDPRRLRQPLPVHLPVRGPRHLRQHHQIRRHHERRQHASQRARERLGVDLAFADHIAHQPLARALTAHHHHGLADSALRQQLRFDLPELDPIASDLHLMVHARHVLDRAVRTPPRQIPCPVQPPSGLAAERIRHEPLRRQPRTTIVAPRQPRAADVQLAHHTDWHDVEIRIQDIAGPLAHRFADRGIGGLARHLRIGRPQQRRDHGLCRAVSIDHQRRLERAPDQLHALARHRFSTHRADPQRDLFALPQHPRRQLTQMARRRVDHAHPFVHHGRVGLLRGPQLVAAHHQTRTVHQRHHPLLHRRVEAQRREVQCTVCRRHRVDLARGLAMHAQAPVRHRHALGLPCRARRVDHVRQVLGAHWHAHRTAQLRLGARLVQTDHRDAGRHVQTRSAVVVSHHHLHRGVGHHVRQPLARVLRIERHIGSARLPDAQHPYHHLHGSRDAEPHQRLRPHPALHELVS